MAQTPACEPDKSEPPAVLADSRFRRSNGSQAAVAVGMPFADALVAVDFVSDRIQASMQMLTTRANSRTMACGPVLGCCSNRF